MSEVKSEATVTASESPAVIGFVLQNGMTIVGKVVGQIPRFDADGSAVARCDGVVLHYPLLVTANLGTQRNDNKVTMRFSPAVPLAKNADFIVNNDHIVFEFEPTEDVADAYTSTILKAETGIELPEKKLLLS